jgi:prolyl-tRNA synthetase
MQRVARLSHLFAPTLKEAPADATAASHRLLVRAGFIRQLGAGIYNLLPLAVRTQAKIEAILREEMAAIGAQELALPALLPADVWRASGRWDLIGAEMFRLSDRRDSEFCLGMTHEEIFCLIARDELRSYRDLPQTWYQIGAKYRDEPRPRFGLLRVREFRMKDAYSFDLDAAGLDRSFELQRGAYKRIFARCGVPTLDVEAFSGMMGGRESVEFVVRTAAGEDFIALCSACGYAANVEVATARTAPLHDVPGNALERFATPGVVTIEALAAPPYNVEPTRQLKTLIYFCNEQPVVAVVRGDHALNEAKLQVATGTGDIRPAQGAEIIQLMGAQAGSLGAVHFERAGVRVLLDEALVGRTNMVTGANQDGFHVTGVDIARDLKAEIVDLRSVLAGDPCPRCDGRLELDRALEVGHIFKLGTRFSDALGATVLTADGTPMPLVMGSYGIGVGRIMASAVELFHDDDGIIWPVAIAPFQATVLTLGPEPELATAAERVVTSLAEQGLDVLYDDRDLRAGVKFKDADLIGIPVRIAVGQRTLPAGQVEVRRRGARQSELVSIADVGRVAAAFLQELA